MSTETLDRATTDGFHLVIDALKLNGLTTIYGVPGIPITTEMLLLAVQQEEALANERRTGKHTVFKPKPKQQPTAAAPPA